jgi:putative ABC transport system ATP-binding protein
VGFIPQQAFWVRSLSVLENIAIPSFISGNGYKESIEKAFQMIKLIKMENWAHYRPFDLSGGQQQRIAFARAMILNPKFIIADEPTGNLDVKTGDYLMGLIQDFNEQFGVSVLVVTHNEDQVKYAKRVIRMLDGQVISNEIREK